MTDILTNGYSTYVTATATVTLPLPRVRPTNFAETEARLAETLPGYEHRPHQAAAATFVENQIAKGEHGLLQAGCGVGKSLATLIPAVLSGKRIVYSTATKALQGQVGEKDLPFLQEHLGVDFTYAILKGRSNYLCRAALADATPSDVPDLVTFMREADEMAEDLMGLREDFSVEVTDAQWSRLTSTSDSCPGKKVCPFGDTCFAEKAKAKARDADVVVVNHALFLTDLMLREVTGGAATMLDEYDVAILDEAHELEAYASNVFGAQFTEAGVRKLLGEVHTFAHRYGLDEQLPDSLGADVMGAMVNLWDALKVGRIRQANLVVAEEEYVSFAMALQGFARALGAVDMDLVPPGYLQAARAQRERLSRRANSLVQRFTAVITDSFDDTVRWVEEESRMVGGRREMVKVIKTAPVDVSIYLRPYLFAADDGPTCILASATIAVAGKFDFIATSLGVDTYSSLDAGTPFDFAQQAQLYVPDLPAPAGKTRAQWEFAAREEMLELIRTAGGRALLLFTSYKQMEAAYQAISPRVPYRCLMQGQRPNKVLAEEFKADETSVLFGVSSFMTGFDVQGPSLSLVVVDKLMFSVPDDPIVEARCDAIKGRGGNDFVEYVVPVMALTLQQAVGRLIRHRNDKGVMAILDSRLIHKPYGKTVLRSLPPAPMVKDRADVEGFFGELFGVGA